MATRPHYPSPSARSAVLWVRILGLGLAVMGGALLLWLAGQDPDPAKLTVVAVNSFGAVAMFGFSSAYDLSRAGWKPFLRPLDHVGIFLMIAATQTLFKARLLSGIWAWA